MKGDVPWPAALAPAVEVILEGVECQREESEERPAPQHSVNGVTGRRVRNDCRTESDGTVRSLAANHDA